MQPRRFYSRILQRVSHALWVSVSNRFGSSPLDSYRWTPAGGLLIVLSLAAGCTSRTDSDKNVKQQGFTMSGMDGRGTTVGKQSDHLARVINLVKNDDVAEWDVFEASITNALNMAWSVAKSGENLSSMVEAFPQWERPALLETIPDVYRESLWWRSIDSETFLYTDSHYIQEQYWLSRVVARVDEEPAGARFAYLTHAGQTQPLNLQRTLLRNDPDLQPEQASSLELALKLFDWTVRNVTGDPFFPVPDPNEAAELAVRPLEPGRPLSFGGVRGPGYRNYLWQTLSYGRGDTWEQGHAFLQLARQAGLDACVLGLPDLAPHEHLPRIAHPTVTAWAIGVMIDDRVFLLDPRLGMPLHHPETLAVLTLQQVIEQPQLLAAQGLTANESVEALSAYPVRGGDLSQIVALLDYPLDGFTLRSQFLQRNLTGSDRIDVYFSPVEIAERFANNPLIDRVELWALPLETQIFRETIREATLRSTRDRSVQSKLQWLSREELYFDDFALLRKSRVLYLLGRFQPDRTGLVQDCLQEFQTMQYTDEDWKNIADNPEMQKTLGLYRSSGQSLPEFQQAMESQKAAMMIVRADAFMYMALAHNEMQNHDTSLTWLRLVPGYDQDGKWKRHTLYMKARGQEAMKNYAAAIETYRSMDREFRSNRSPREYGSLLRARILAQRTASPGTTPTEN